MGRKISILIISFSLFFGSPGISQNGDTRQNLYDESFNYSQWVKIGIDGKLKYAEDA